MNTTARTAMAVVGLLAIVLMSAATVVAHDGWVQTNVTRTGVGEMV